MYAIRWRSKAFPKATGWYCNSACEVETFGHHFEAVAVAARLTRANHETEYTVEKYREEDNADDLCNHVAAHCQA